MSLSNRVKIFLQVTFVIAVFGAGIRVADIGDSATMLGRGFGLDEVKVGAPGEFGEGEFGIADAIAQAVPVRALSADEIRELTGSWSSARVVAAYFGDSIPSLPELANFIDSCDDPSERRAALVYFEQRIAELDSEQDRLFFAREIELLASR